MDVRIELTDVRIERFSHILRALAPGGWEAPGPLATAVSHNLKKRGF